MHQRMTDMNVLGPSLRGNRRLDIAKHIREAEHVLDLHQAVPEKALGVRNIVRLDVVGHAREDDVHLQLHSEGDAGREYERQPMAHLKERK